MLSSDSAICLITCSLITGVTEQADNSTLEKYCYNDDASSECATYGGLYQWGEAMQYSVAGGAQGICPTGWHIPTDHELYILEHYLTDSPNTCDGSRFSAADCDPAGTKLKVGGSSGFEAILVGARESNGSFSGQGTYTNFWSSTNSSQNAYRRLLDSNSTVYRDSSEQILGFSIRCLQN